MATQDDYIRTALRVPPELHAKIHESAKANNRTFNAEIVARLEGSFLDQKFPVTEDFAHPERKLSQAGWSLTEMASDGWGVSVPEALERLVALGYATSEHQPVFIFYARPGMTMGEIREALKESSVFAPQESVFMLEKLSSEQVASRNKSSKKPNDH